MMAMRHRAAGGVLLLVLASGLLGACSRELFVDQDRQTDRRMRYYDNDSATETTQARKQAVGMPFGPSQGSSEQ